MMSNPDHPSPISGAAAEPLHVSYESADYAPSGPRKWWAYGVLAIYLLLATSLLTSPVWVGGALGADRGQIAILALVVTVLTLCGLALLIVPVRARRHRPITRRSIVIPILASGLLIGCLVLGAGIALAQLFAPEVHESYGTDHNPRDITMWAVFIAAAAVWIAWSVVLILASRRGDPASVGMKLHRRLLAGSVLELLVAVPAHIIVRRRHDCCGGVLTGTGICLGVVVALVSFGPAALLLYHHRRNQITGADKLRLNRSPPR
jgi:hypothetical protein